MRGTLIYVMGPSGSGKDSLLSALRPRLRGLPVAFIHPGPSQGRPLILSDLLSFPYRKSPERRISSFRDFANQLFDDSLALPSHCASLSLVG